MLRIGCSLLAILLVGACSLALEPAHADDSLFVPKNEVLQLLDTYALELGTNTARPGSGTSEEPYGTLPADRRARLVELAAADGIPAFSVPNILMLIPNRVEAAIRDFYAANLAPVQQGKLNVDDLGMPVLRTELDRLKRAKADLDAYAKQVLQPLREAEWNSIETRFRFELKKMQVFDQKVREINEQYPAFGGGDGTARTKAIDAALQTLSTLAKQWNDLDAADAKLAQAYVRKTFLFPLPPPYTGQNAARLIVDGHDYYGRLDELLGEVVNKARGQGRVHIALWWCKANTLISPTETFLDAIKRVAAAGNEVQVLLWAGSSFSFPREQADNEDCAARINALGGKAEAKLISGPWDGSHHDKYFVVYDGADYRSLVGGMNIDVGQWTSSLGATMAPHPHSNGGWFDVHDIGVELEGPSVIDVDLDFRQRWSEAGGTRTVYAEKASYPAGEDVNEVAIAVTSSTHETWAGKIFGAFKKQTGVRDELLQRIAAADRYVYLENYAILDEQLIKALGHKIAQQQRLGRPFDVILVTHLNWSPTSPSLYGWLHYITYLSLSFMNTDSFTYLDENGLSQSVDKQHDGSVLWEVGPYKGAWNEKTEVMWSSGGAVSHAKLTSILSFGHDLPLNYLAYRDASGKDVPIWVHSKFGLFDDDYALIGSANFNFRSLTTDNELSAFVHGPSAAGFRQMLWSEYWGNTVPAPGGWAAAVAALSNIALRNNEVVVRPLTLKDFPRNLSKIISRMTWSAEYGTNASWY